MKKLTDRQAEVLQFIAKFIDEHAYAPTIRQIAEHFGLSVKAAYDHVSALKRKEKIRSTTRSSRTMEIVHEKDERVKSPFLEIPILGEVAAGLGILSEENHNGCLPVHRSMLKKNKKYFAVKVRGDSMEGIGVMDGDMAVIEKHETAQNGDVVVAMINEGYVLKKFYKQKSNIKLVSANTKYHPIYSSDIRILGHLAFVFRSYA
jgi:repressor LexA